MYEIMRYWDDDDPEWDAEEHAFAAAWRNQPKWVVSRSLKSVGPNASLVEDDLEGAIRELKAERDGEIEGPRPRSASRLMIGSARMWPDRLTFLFDLATRRMEIAAEVSTTMPAC